MDISLPIEVLTILKRLKDASFDAYVVGGAVRDVLMKNRDVTDFDFTTNAKPEELLALFPESYYENTFGTVSITMQHLHEQLPAAVAPLELTNTNVTESKVINIASASKVHDSLKDAVRERPQLEKKQVYEITTYRTDGNYTNRRHPESVSWGQTLREDIDRRDFTINALALEVSLENTADVWQLSPLPREVTIKAGNYTIHDFHNGTQDLQNGVIRTVGDPTTRFTEDALRMLRAIRFSVQLSMTIEPETYQALIHESPLLEHVSWERIRDEFFKMLAAPHPRKAIELLDETHMLSWILPELLDAKGVQQGGHHTTDVWEHSLAALESCPSPQPLVRLATLIHDIGKPATYSVQNGNPTFYNHEIVGSRIAKTVARRFKLSNSETDRLFILVRYHMFHYQPENTDASIRRFMRKVGLDNLDDILDLREGDRLGSGTRKTSWRLEEMKQRMIEQLHQPFAITDLAINGTDLMEQLGLKPGPQIGIILKTLFEEVLENPELNTKEILLEKAATLYNSQKK